MVGTPDGPNDSLPGGKPPRPAPARKTPPKKSAQRKPETNEAADAFAFAAASGGSSASAALKNRRRKSSASAGTFLLFGGLATVALVAVLAFTLLRDDSPPFTVRPIERQKIAESAPFELLVKVDSSESFGGSLQYSLENGPTGAIINAKSGKFTWQPSESQGPGSYEMTVYVSDVDDPQLEQTVRLTIDVTEVNSPPVFKPIEDRMVAADKVLTFSVRAQDTDAPSQKLRYSLAPGSPQGASIDAISGRFTWKPGEAEPGNEYHFEITVSEATADGLSTTVGFDVRLEAADQVTALPEDTHEINLPEDTPRTPIDIPEPEATPYEKAQAKVLAMYVGEENEEGKKAEEAVTLFSPAEYPALRKVFADLFQQQHQPELKQAFGADYEEMTAWLEDHIELKEEFYTAIDPQADKIVPALKLFNEIRKNFPEKIVPYGELAIATALVWDSPHRAVYSYDYHASRAKAKLPEGKLAAIENFQYLVDAEHMMQGRVRYMPWEFLLLTVNHCTPLNERKWAMANYWAKREMFGKCYKDVPYDKVMLASDDKMARLNGQIYNLPNLVLFGGVCSYQADYAARVGKSIGIPAAYVGGKSRYGEGHAWVMWVELLGVTPNNISFSLQSYGRYRDDKYYVGTLDDPQTGKQITDRQLELRLQTVGLNPLAKRHSTLVMKALPMLVDKAEMDVAEQLQFLFKVTDLCAGNEDAWLALARMSRDGLIEDEEDIRQMSKVLGGMFRIFRDFPDFTWELFDDLIAFQDDPVQRGVLYGQLVLSYESVGRPDLACEARLKYVDYLVAEQKHALAIEGLAGAILKFPEEGRYAPKMLDRLEELCKQVPGKQLALLNFYKMYLPKIPKMRGSRPSEYCVKMHERAIQRFKEAGDIQSAAMYEMQLKLIRAGTRMRG